MKITGNHYKQRGVASILTVLFFTVIVSIVTLSFVRLSQTESEQALEDTLSKSALSAAYSGVNDAKRAILFCMENPSNPACVGLNDQNCPQGFTATMGPVIGTAYDAGIGGVRVGDPSINERYSCATIISDTSDVAGSLDIDSDTNTVLLPLRSIGDFNQIRLSWQPSSDDVSTTGLDYCVGGNCNTTHASYRDTDAYGAYFNYQPNWPAMMRVSLFTQTGAINLNGAGDGINTGGLSEQTSFLYPTSSAAAGTGWLTGRKSITCRSGANGYTVYTPDRRYACQVTIPVNSVANDYYLQLTNVYNDTEYMVELRNTAIPGNTNVLFDNVMPEIDSTGAVDNTYRRVKVRVMNAVTPIMPSAIDTGAGICKDFTVSSAAGSFGEGDCGY